MEILFTKALNVKEQPIEYSVSFHDEQYFFESKNGSAMNFSLRREDDEWHTTDNMDEDLKDQAVTVLEEYLLAQH